MKKDGVFGLLDIILLHSAAMIRDPYEHMEYTQVNYSGTSGGLAKLPAGPAHKYSPLLHKYPPLVHGSSSFSTFLAQLELVTIVI